MKSLAFSTIGIICLLFGANTIYSQARTNNTISGFVFDAENRSPVGDVYVELLNDTYSTLSRAKTDGSGRFFFGGISGGNFKVRVLPYGTNYEQQEQDVSILNSRVGSAVLSDSVYIDIYLRIDKRKVSVENLGRPDTIFVQDVPEQAKKLYKESESYFAKDSNPELGISNLRKALEVFPDYYDALNKLGNEYVKRKEYFESIPFLIRAIKINSRSYSGYYMLGVAAFNLKQYKESEEAFKSAVFLNSQSVYALIQYGMILRINGKYKESEENLLKSAKIAKESVVPETHWQLALLYQKTDRFEEAAKQLEKYLKIQPDQTDSKKIKELISVLRAKAQKNT